ncbi:serine--tRNA ligase [Micromonospora sagamiensis]|uniref:serine--tRNA ligase n=1 Tax=Micromonospora sagamiensis TaxID=47875 RepID=UPI002467B705|nr:serine--tRNA ligase [Micromonospora sagamiensis]
MGRDGQAVLDLTQLLTDTEAVADRLATKGVEKSLVLSARDAVERRRAVRLELDGLRETMNRRSKESGKIIARGGDEAEKIRQELIALKRDVADAEARFREAEQHERQLLLVLPNLPAPEAPVGSDESHNVVLRYGGPEAKPDPSARPHWEVAGELGIFEPERAAKLSGSGFSVLRGDGARLLRALVQLGLDLNRDTYEETVVPHFVRGDTMVGTGHLPKFRDDTYSTVDDLWAVPTGEVPLTGLHRDELLDDAQLPLRYMTHTACFRREAGSAGKDTRGMQRLHEFHKVELVRICRPEEEAAELAALLADAERTLLALELPYRVVDLCTGDLTFSSSRIFDLEVYSPGVDKWLEVSSVGDFTDFQARRSNIRYRAENGRPRFVRTLNGSGMATPRVWAALIEHGQLPDGRVRLPEALWPYMGGEFLRPSPRR